MGQPLTLPGNLKSPTLSIHHRDKCVTESVCLGTDFTSTWISCRVVPLLPSRYLKYQCAACRLIVRPRRGCLLCCCWESYDLCWGASAQDPGARMLSAEWAKRGWAAWVVGACLYRPLHAGTGFLCFLGHDLPHPQPPAWRWRSSAISWPSLGHLKCVFHYIKDGSRTSERFSHLPKVMETREPWRGAPDSRILRETPIKKNIYIYLPVLGLHCCMQAFSSFGEQGHSLIELRRLLIAVASLWSTEAVVVALGLRCWEACGIFPDQGLNLCPLHWQADSQPLDPQGSPGRFLWLYQMA